MGVFKVSTIFKARDKISGAFDKMRKRSKLFGDDASRAFSKASRAGSRFGDTLKAFLTANVLMKGISLLKQGLGAVLTQFIDFDQAIISASAKFKGLNLRTAQGQATLQELKRTARAVGAATQFSAGQAAGGLDFLAMAGFNAEQSIAALPGVVDLSTVANLDLARSTDIASDSLGAFGLMTKDTTKLQVNFTRLNDVMAKTMSSTNTNMEDLFETIKKGAPAFTAAGQSLESFSALAGTMANSGVKASESGTNLRNIMLRLAKPTGEAQKQLDKMNITTKDSKGNFLDIVDILGQFEKSTKKMGTQQKTAALATIFGARAVTGINILLKAGTKSIRSFRKELMNAGGESKRMASIMRKSLQNRIKSLQSAAIELGFKFITAFEKQGGGALDKFTAFVRKINIQPLIDAMKSLLLFGKGLLGIFQLFAPILKPLIAAFLTWKLILLGIMALKAPLVLWNFLKVIKVVTAAQWLWNAAMVANPVGLIVAGVALLIGAIVLLIVKWKSVKKFFVDGAKAIWTALKGLFGVFKSIFSLFGDATSKDMKAKVEQKKTTEFIAPNKEEAKAQQINFNGRLDIAGAPAGSTVKSETKGAAPVGLELLGANI